VLKSVLRTQGLKLGTYTSHASVQIFVFGISSHSRHLVSVSGEVGWRKGGQDAIVLNVDDSALTNPEKTDFGGLVGNFHGTLRFGFYGSVGLSNILHAEI
ncbi:hypothetical protein A2U01_0012479, partial [Trifolium medium]|nr:hypothetical protein [Trifolium medium]